MGYVSGQPILWPFRPDWSSPVKENLAWLTDVLQATAGAQQARALRGVPRRSFSYQSTVHGDLRRAADAIRFDVGVQQVRLPIYPDSQMLTAALSSAATSIPCVTAGFDFVAGGEALLWASVNQWELVSIDSVAGDHLALTDATTQAWSAGTWLYPVRKARLQDAPQASALNDEVSSVQVSMLIDEPCDWTSAWPTTTTYRSEAVLEWRNEESENPTDTYDRRGNSVDNSVGPIWYMDLPGMPFRAQSQRFALHGRAQHTSFRSLLYQLTGRAGRVWVPSWLADVRLTQSVGSSSAQLTVPWMGYTQFGRQQVGRRDIAIELNDGTRFYRRITDSAEASGSETLTLDAALGEAVDPSQVRQIGWLSLCAQGTDTASIEHQTDADGIGISTIHWQALKNDV